MRERLRQLGGTLEIGADSGWHASARASVPLREVSGDTPTEDAANETAGPAGEPIAPP